MSRPAVVMSSQLAVALERIADRQAELDVRMPLDLLPFTFEWTDWVERQARYAEWEERTYHTMYEALHPDHRYALEVLAPTWEGSWRDLVLTSALL